MSFKKQPRPTAWQKRTTVQRMADAQRVYEVRIQRGATKKDALSAARELYSRFPRPAYDTTPGKKEQAKIAARAAAAAPAEVAVAN